jgi:hypothetical protein
MNYKLKMAVFFLSLTSLFACTQPAPKIKLQSGDLLFRGATSGQLSEAIDKVT